MKFTTLIPTSRNDGQAVSRQEMDEIVQMFWVFGGCSVDGPIQGHWIDEQTGIHYADRCYRIVVVCDNDRLSEAQDVVMAIGRRLDQEAMYFEVRDFDGVRFLRTK